MATTDEYGNTYYLCGCINYVGDDFSICEKHMMIILKDDISKTISDGC